MVEGYLWDISEPVESSTGLQGMRVTECSVLMGELTTHVFVCQTD